MVSFIAKTLEKGIIKTKQKLKDFTSLESSSDNGWRTAKSIVFSSLLPPYSISLKCIRSGCLIPYYLLLSPFLGPLKNHQFFGLLFLDWLGNRLMSRVIIEIRWEIVIFFFLLSGGSLDIFSSSGTSFSLGLSTSFLFFYCCFLSLRMFRS